jgi:histidinol phosphatase-like enzyme (inositol monophosphatase family)
MSESSLQQILDFAIEAAYIAGRRALAYYNTPLPVETKSDDTPVTRADRESEQIIRTQITAAFPTHSILGEEAGQTIGSPDFKWIIDPIDGTKSFIHGVPLWGVMIGVEIRQQPSVGVVYLPALDEMIAAATGMGCTRNGRPTRVSSVNRLDDATLLSSSITTAMRRSDCWEKLASRTKLHRTWGDCFGHIMVATGRAEIMLDAQMKPWDAAALLPILTEAGGHFTSWKGEPTIWANEGVSTNAALHEQVLDILKTEKRRA